MLAATCLSLASLAAPPAVTISFDAATRAEPATGRLVLYLIADSARMGADPADAPFFDNPQPMFGIDVTALPPGASATIDDTATSFPVRWSALPPGRYKAQAVLDLHRENSSWKREPGNLWSETVAFEVTAKDAPPPVAIKLTRVVGPQRVPEPHIAEVFEVRSALLSDFHGRDVTLRAGVLLPTSYNDAANAARTYAAVYEVPGFGGDHTGIHPFHPFRARLPAGSPWLPMRENAFWIVLDPESANGHTLFADSANNGPCGRALVEELIPAIEKKYRLTPDPKARLLRGHSSGGWSTLWLAVTYPETFGACWSSSPDPVDFRRMQLCNIYDEGMYLLPPQVGYSTIEQVVEYERLRERGGAPSYRSNGTFKMTVREENLMEEVIGPDNTSGQQWDSWFAVWGPRNERGNPAALFDPVTGLIDKAIAEKYRAYDIADLVRRDAGRVALLFQERIRLVVGDQDNYYLNEAVAMLKAEVEKVNFLHLPEGGHGRITIVPGRDHGTIFGVPEIQNIPAEMVDHLQRAGFIRK
ncbi:MAG: alpha/beta hydrolase-fold protein [Phycisphaerales bacterium]